MAKSDKTITDTEAEAPVRSSFVILERINHNREDYEPGETILLTEEQALPLLTVSAIASIPES